MNQLKTQLYSHCNGIHEDDFQVAYVGHAGNSEKGTVLLVPAPGSSPFDEPIEGKENQRLRLATKIKEDGYTVLTMIPPGKPNHTFSGKKSEFSFNEYASCIESVLFRDFYKKSVTHIVTSSLGQIATILALNNDNHINKSNRTIIIGAPIDSLQKVLLEQKKKAVSGITDEMIMHYYAKMHGLLLDEKKIDKELQDNTIRTLGISHLVDNGYNNVSIYGNNDDRYYLESDNSKLKFVHFFQDYNNTDPFFHGFTEKSALEAPEIVKQFLNNTYREKIPYSRQDLFIKGLLGKTYIF